jgi:hypothetical protein
VLRHAETLARSKEDTTTLELAARSKCRTEYAAVRADFTLDAATVGNQVLNEPEAHLKDLERELSEDFAGQSWMRYERPD